MKRKSPSPHAGRGGSLLPRAARTSKAMLSVLLTASWALFQQPAAAEVKVPQILGDHMVMQRQMPVPVWGTDTPGQKITVKFRDQTKETTAAADGKWMVKLDPLQAGGPEKMVIVGSSQLILNDILVGEVWVGSGQSNMANSVSIGLENGKRFNAPDTKLASLAAATYPQIRMYTSKGAGHDQWQEAAPANIPQFSGLLFSFGVPLQRELNVPVGLVVGAVGGTPSCMWLSKEAYQTDAACTDSVKKFATTYPFDELQKKYEADKAAYDQALAASQGTENKPRLVQPRPPGKAGEPLPGWKVGDHFESRIRPLIPYAMRGVLWDQGESGTGLVGVAPYTLMGALIHSWRKDWGQGDFPFLYVQKPSGGGLAWDANDPVTSQADKFAPVVGKGPRPNDVSGFSRETFLKIMKYPGASMVASSDLGGGTHPTNKSGYGERAVRAAMGAVYGKKIEIYGPLYESHAIEGDKVRIKFTHTGDGLAFRNGDKPQGFAIAGDDQKFVWADAAIDGTTVVVSSPAVPKPAAVRYAWSAAIPWANLFSKGGLPAQAFRTDAWPVPSDLLRAGK
ncbi:MAG: hypothetical protein PHQ12_00045 [Chthoniobacteraceae bacterium]|nr:hypothetical protein [Chthoniobacteraceae bacterium]